MGTENENDHTWIQEQENDNSYIDSTSIDTILCACLSQFSINKAHMKTATQLWKYIPYIQVLPQLCFQSHLHQYSDSAEVEAHKKG